MKTIKKILKKVYDYKIILIIIILIILLFVFKDYYINSLETLLDKLGYGGIFLIIFFQELIFIQPISPVAIIILATVGGMNFIYLSIVAGIASSLAALIDYYIGRKYGRKLLSNIIKKEQIDKTEKFFKKHGRLAVILGAMSPFPYGIVCYFAGQSKMDVKIFMISTISRFTAFLFIAILTKIGFL